MHVRFYGVRGGYPDTEQLVSLVVSTSEAKVLLDAGSTWIFQNRDDLLGLDYALISHIHNDHVAMLPHLVLARLQQGISTPLPITAPEPVTEIMAGMGFGKDDPAFCQTTTVPARILDIRLSALETQHSRKNLCYRLETEVGSLAYTGDTACFDNLAEFCAGVDVLVCEASCADASLEKANHWGHLTPQTAARLIDAARPLRTILTHFMEMDGAAFASSVKQHLGRPADVVAAYGGYELNLK